MQLETPVEQIKGVGAKTGALLVSAGLVTVGDLVEFLPRSYEDYTSVIAIRDLLPGNVVLKGRFTNVSARYVRRGLHVTQAVLVDESGKVPVTWFNQPYRAKQLEGNHEWLVAGEFALSQRRYQLMNPSVRSSDEVLEQGSVIVPIYRQVGGLKTAQLRKIIDEIRPIITMLPEYMPVELVQREKLLSYADAMVALHFPESAADVEQGKQRIAFQEILELLYASALNKADNAALTSWHIAFDVERARDFVAKLPFALTGAQRKAVWDIIQNFASGQPMNRLLQGDVGSGKTIVAGMCAYMAAQAGYQSALLAPTELLAIQHARTLAGLLETFGVTVGLLTGSLAKKPKELLKQQIKAGAVAVTVGTHALLQDDVNFAKLGFVVIDEQHRFGVAQRQKLLLKSANMPHMLAMTATPIPRSLQLTVYGELEVSILGEKPVGRKEILTKIVSPTSRSRLFETIDQSIGHGRQLYVVCPLIESTEANQKAGETELRSVTFEYERLRRSSFKHRRIGLLHGKLSSDEKQQVMQAFVARELDILVSTTVIEVGVDVPNATIMVIEGAERFGLAQLHQLRGRVGRGDEQSYCYLIPTEPKQTTSIRLKEIERSSDGFYLAERDLELRGPGEIYGRMQHGQLNLQVASLADTRLIAHVQDVIAWAAEQSIDLLQCEGMKRRVERYRRITTLN